MTAKYWIKIALGILVIFVLGWGGCQGIHKGKDFVVDKMPSPLMLMLDRGFRLDGDKEGDISRIQFMRTTPGQIDSAVITVEFNSAEDIHQLDGCILRVVNGHPFANDTHFECTSEDDSASLALVRFGHVTVMPEGKEFPLFVASSASDDIHHSAYRGAGGDSGNVDINGENGNFSITVGGKELVKAVGDSNGSSFVIRDEKGNTIVNFHKKGKTVRTTIKVDSSDN